jgi:hypothetical protein
MLWDEDDSRWAEGGLDSALVLGNGKIYGTTFNPFTKQSQAHMCGGVRTGVIPPREWLAVPIPAQTPGF